MFKDLQVQQAIKVFRGLLARKVSRVYRDLPGLPARRVTKVFKA